jgi:hypothetical protein
MDRFMDQYGIFVLFAFFAIVALWPVWLVIGVTLLIWSMLRK